MINATAPTQADLWNEEADRNEDRIKNFLGSLPKDVLLTNSTLREFKGKTVLHQAYLDRAENNGSASTICLIWFNGHYYTFATDAMKVLIMLPGYEEYLKAVDGVLTLQVDQKMAQGLIARGEHIKHRVRRFNN